MARGLQAGRFQSHLLVIPSIVLDLLVSFPELLRRPSHSVRCLRSLTTASIKDSSTWRDREVNMRKLSLLLWQLWPWRIVALQQSNLPVESNQHFSSQLSVIEVNDLHALYEVANFVHREHRRSRSVDLPSQSEPTSGRKFMHVAIRWVFKIERFLGIGFLETFCDAFVRILALAAADLEGGVVVFVEWEVDWKVILENDVDYGALGDALEDESE